MCMLLVYLQPVLLNPQIWGVAQESTVVALTLSEFRVLNIGIPLCSS